MGDKLVDDVLKSVEPGSPMAINTPALRPVIESLVNRMRDFGYEDDHIRAILISGG